MMALGMLAMQSASAQFPGFGRSRDNDSKDGTEERHNAPQLSFSPEEYRKQQQEFLTDKSGLTKDEAEKFFPIYFELQDKKNEINANSRSSINLRENNGHLTDADYTKMIDNLAEAKIQTAKLEKEYLEKFKKIVPASKLIRIQVAETQFGSEIIKEMQHSAQQHMMNNSMRFPGIMNMRNQMAVPFGRGYQFDNSGTHNHMPNMQPNMHGGMPVMPGRPGTQNKPESSEESKK